MFQLIGAVRTLNRYGSNATEYEKKSCWAIEKLRFFREENNVNYLDADDRNYATELKLIKKIGKIESAKKASLQCTSIGLANNVLKSVLPGPIGDICGVMSTAARSLIQAEESSEQPAVISAITAVAEREVQRECLRGATTAVADLAGTAAIAMALPTAIATGVVTGTVAAIASSEIRSSMWSALQNTVNGSIALGKDWTSYFCAHQNQSEALINSHGAIDNARRKFFIKKAEFMATNDLKARREAELQSIYTQQSHAQRELADRQTHWFSRFCRTIAISENLFYKFLAVIFCHLSSSFAREQHWHVSNNARLKMLNTAVNHTVNDVARLNFSASRLLRSVNKRANHISTLAEQYLLVLHAPSA